MNRPLGGGRAAAYVLLDCFTDQPLCGNQLAVFTPTAQPLEGDLMQRIARELNLSETVFLEPTDGEMRAKARIFTPLAELPFAGHPVLGAAVVVGSTDRADRVSIVTAAGPVAVGLDWSAAVPRGRMTQPLPSWDRFGAERELLAALGVAGSRLPIELYSNGPRFAMVVLADEKELAQLAPDITALAQLGQLGAYCTAARENGSWEVRMFAPAFGIAEDPATGSGAGLLATHLARHGLTAFGAEIEIHQGLRIGRPSRLYARVSGGPERIERVEVAGDAVIVGGGELRLP
ncbi:MAG: PhzF family phenazine biosynthesis isomerase [Solirubrobacteraceae bacterium]